MIRLLVRLVLVLVLIAALLIGMTCCAARVVFDSCAEIGVQQPVRNPRGLYDDFRASRGL